MEFLKEFINQYGMQIIYAVLTAIAGAIGIMCKNIYKRISEDKTKKTVAKTVVQAVEQLYKDLHGEEKYNKAVEALIEMLGEKGITISELEIKMLIEAAVGEFNNSFMDKAALNEGYLIVEPEIDETVEDDANSEKVR